MLVSGVYPWVVRIGIVQLIAPVQVNAVRVEEDDVLREHDVDVEREEHRQQLRSNPLKGSMMCVRARVCTGVWACVCACLCA